MSDGVGYVPRYTRGQPVEGARSAALVDAPTMPRAHRIANLALVFVPLVGLPVAVILLWNDAVDAIDLGIFLVTYAMVGIGVTIGLHRLLTHGSFQTHRWVRYLLAILGSFALEASVIDWVADHRKHHAFADLDGDPHSPHVGEGAGLRGLWHAHVGWLFETQGQADHVRYARELHEDPGMRLIDRMFLPLCAFGLLLPAALGWLLHGNAEGALRGFVWGGLVRALLIHHITWSINSVCHFFGRRRFATDDRATNVGWLAIPSMGESWHHNHHAFPRSAAHGLGRWEIDLGALVIRAMERVGLAWNVVWISPERQREKLAG